MGCLRKGRRGGGDRFILVLGCGCWRWAIWIAECIVIDIAISWVAVALAGPLTSAVPPIFMLVLGYSLGFGQRSTELFGV